MSAPETTRPETSGRAPSEMVCLITGATSGIGRATARALARSGMTLVLAGRDEARTRTVVEAIGRASPDARVEYLLADLSEQAQVRRLADEFKARHARLDVLVNNAGALFWRRRVTVDGQEMTFALNHLAPFLLTNLLLDTLRSSAPARVVTVASAAHQGARIPFDDLRQGHGRYRPFGVYSETKLANLLFTYELARRLDGTGVTANAAHPGFVASNFAYGHNPWLRAGMLLTRPFSVSPEKGARTSVYLASSPDVAGVTGQYFAKCRPIRSSAASYDREAARRLWDVSAEIVGLRGHASTNSG